MPAYDCSTCRGDAREEEIDCVECGGTGYHPPADKKPDAWCRDCGRELWRGTRGPKWFENAKTGDALCSWCLEAKKLLRAVEREMQPRREQVVRASKRYL